MGGRKYLASPLFLAKIAGYYLKVMVFVNKKRGTEPLFLLFSKNYYSCRASTSSSDVEAVVPLTSSLETSQVVQFGSKQAWSENR